jgi:hypothetical protein
MMLVSPAEFFSTLFSQCFITSVAETGLYNKPISNQSTRPITENMRMLPTFCHMSPTLMGVKHGL